MVNKCVPVGYRAIPSSSEIAAGNNILKHYLSSEGSLLNWNIWPVESLRASHVKGGSALAMHRAPQ